MKAVSRKSRSGKKTLTRSELMRRVKNNVIYSYKQNHEPSDVEVIKMLSCYLYQCAEGDIYKTDLYILMRELRGDLCYSIVANSEEFNNAEDCWR